MSFYTRYFKISLQQGVNHVVDEKFEKTSRLFLLIYQSISN